MLPVRRSLGSVGCGETQMMAAWCGSKMSSTSPDASDVSFSVLSAAVVTSTVDRVVSYLAAANGSMGQPLVYGRHSSSSSASDALGRRRVERSARNGVRPDREHVATVNGAERLGGRTRYVLVRELELQDVLRNVDLLDDERLERLRQLLGVVLLDERAQARDLGWHRAGRRRRGSRLGKESLERCVVLRVAMTDRLVIRAAADGLEAAAEETYARVEQEAGDDVVRRDDRSCRGRRGHAEEFEAASAL